jgi:hypothetical protein
MTSFQPSQPRQPHLSMPMMISKQAEVILIQCQFRGFLLLGLFNLYG